VIAQEPRRVHWMRYAQVPEGVRVTWNPPRGLASLTLYLVAKPPDEDESIALLGSGTAPWERFSVPAGASTLLLNTDSDERPFYTLLARDADGNYLDLEFRHSATGEANEAVFVDDAHRGLAEERLAAAVAEVRAKAPEAAAGYNWSGFVFEAGQTARFYPGHAMVDELLAWLARFKSEGEQSAKLAEANAAIDKAEAELGGDAPNARWIAEQMDALLAEHPALSRAQDLRDRAREVQSQQAQGTALFDTARQALRDGDLRGGVAMLKQAVGLCPSDPAIRHELEQQETLVAFDDALDAIGADAPKLFALGKVEREADRWHLAVRAFARAFAAGHESAHLHSWVRSRIHVDGFQAAAASFSEAVAEGSPAGASASAADLEAAGVQLRDDAAAIVQATARDRALQDEERALQAQWFAEPASQRLELRDRIDRALKAREALRSERESAEERTSATLTAMLGAPQ
jgi:hypothetical protein